MKKPLVLSILLVLICKLSLSTPQARDVLYWNGIIYYVYPYINVEKTFDDAQLKKLNEKIQEGTTTSNWRGYSYEFEICHDSLFLISIMNNDGEDLMAHVFGSNKRVMMDDVNDTLYLGHGKTFFNEQFPTAIYENEMTVVFKNGIVKWHEDHKDKSKPSDFSPYSTKFNEYIYSSIQWGALDENILEEKPKVHVEYSIDSTGKVFNVILLKSSGYPDFDKEAMRVVAMLPDFPTYFVCGKYLNCKYKLRIDFDKSKMPHHTNSSEPLRNGTYYESPNNQLNQMILGSVCSYIKDYNALAKQTDYDTIQYFCADGLSADFPMDDLPCDVFSLQWIEGNPLQIKKHFKHSTTVAGVTTTIHGNMITIHVSTFKVKVRKKHAQIDRWSNCGQSYYYTYSCEEKKWIKVPNCQDW
jgi:TonB family protein